MTEEEQGRPNGEREQCRLLPLGAVGEKSFSDPTSDTWKTIKRETLSGFVRLAESVNKFGQSNNKKYQYSHHQNSSKYCKNRHAFCLSAKSPIQPQMWPLGPGGKVHLLFQNTKSSTEKSSFST